MMPAAHDAGSAFRSTPGAARSETWVRPCGSWPRAHPILPRSSAFKGPGHNSPLATGTEGKTYMMSHAWEAGHVGKKPGRVLCMDEVTWVRAPGAPRQAQRPLSAPQPVGAVNGNLRSDQR